MCVPVKLVSQLTGSQARQPWLSGGLAGDRMLVRTRLRLTVYPTETFDSRL